MTTARTSFTSSEASKPRTASWLLEADAERSFLADRLEKMSRLLTAPRPNHIDEADWHLMKMQFSAMALYHDLLCMRIGRHE